MFEGLFQPMHMLIILIIALIIFGPAKLPQLGSDLGKSIREFKKALKEGESKEDKPSSEDEKTKLEHKD